MTTEVSMYFLALVSNNSLNLLQILSHRAFNGRGQAFSQKDSFGTPRCYVPPSVFAHTSEVQPLFDSLQTDIRFFHFPIPIKALFHLAAVLLFELFVNHS